MASLAHDICLARYRPSVCPSVRPSVTRVDQSKTVEVRIMKFSTYGSPITPVFAEWGRQTKKGWGLGKQVIF